jgi:hypothetical protein
MATRSNIAIKTLDGNWLSVYVHFDGQPSNILPILNTHYENYDKTLEMIMEGDRSVLNEPDQPKKLYGVSPMRHTSKPELMQAHIYYGELNPDNKIEWSYI